MAEDREELLVPRRPTNAMLEAADRYGCVMAGSDLSSDEMTVGIWQAMLAAAPTPPAQGDAVDRVMGVLNYWFDGRLKIDRNSEMVQQLAALAALPRTGDPIPVTIFCPQCSVPHLDEGEWVTRPHKTHQCQSCGHEWRPFPFATVGVAHPPAQEAPVRCAHEAYQGSCAHCGVPIVNGRAVAPNQEPKSPEGEG